MSLNPHVCEISNTHSIPVKQSLHKWWITVQQCRPVTLLMSVSTSVGNSDRLIDDSLIRDVPQTTWVFSCALYSSQFLCNKCSNRNQLTTGQIYALLNTARFLAKKTEDHKCKICSVIYKFLHSVKKSHKNLTMSNWNWQLISNISSATIKSMHRDSKGHKNIIPNA